MRTDHRPNRQPLFLAWLAGLNLVLLLLAPSGSEAGVTFTPIFLDGQSAPGLPEGQVLEDPTNNGRGQTLDRLTAAVNARGDVVFTASLDNGFGVWVAAAATPDTTRVAKLVTTSFALKRSPALRELVGKDLSTRTMALDGGPAINANGDVAITVQLDHWRIPIILQPSTARVVPLSTLGGISGLSDTGEVCAFGKIGATKAIRCFGISEARTIVSLTSGVPELGTGLSIHKAVIRSQDSQGRVAFSAWLTGTGVTGRTDETLWFADSRGRSLIASEGDPLPGTNWVIRGFHSSKICNGRVLVHATATSKEQPADTQSSSSGIAFLWSGGRVREIAETKLDSMHLTPGGKVLSTSGEGLVFGSLSNLESVTLGDGTIPKGRRPAVRKVVANGAGQLLVEASESSGAGRRAVWVGSPQRMVRCLSVGDRLEVAPGDVRTISEVAILKGESLDDGFSTFNDRGEFLLRARFDPVRGQHAATTALLLGRMTPTGTP